ncbi:hypothetical protein KQX54_010973 [Cotesia glomerata]|uniref:Maturase K n=1 Tax=Cotesia glomerata TaxID=32391 RepID=A0AAV7J7C0_COTGL|nr:hypothetical protein KQX54_010973 [Cotesia glomerata]
MRTSRDYYWLGTRMYDLWCTDPLSSVLARIYFSWKNIAELKELRDTRDLTNLTDAASGHYGSNFMLLILNIEPFLTDEKIYLDFFIYKSCLLMNTAHHFQARVSVGQAKHELALALQCIQYLYYPNWTVGRWVVGSMDVIAIPFIDLGVYGRARLYTTLGTYQNHWIACTVDDTIIIFSDKPTIPCPTLLSWLRWLCSGVSPATRFGISIPPATKLFNFIETAERLKIIGLSSKNVRLSAEFSLLFRRINNSMLRLYLNQNSEQAHVCHHLVCWIMSLAQPTASFFVSPWLGSGWL